jgi:hypothetical protein
LGEHGGISLAAGGSAAGQFALLYGFCKLLMQIFKELPQEKEYQMISVV